MKWTVALLVVVGAVAALCAALLVAGVRAGSKDRFAGNDTPHDVDVLVAARPLPALTVVDAASVIKKTMKSDEIPADARMLYTDVIGAVLVAPIVEGEAFTKRHFATGESGVSLAATLPAGMRAMSVMLSEQSGIEDHLYPGCSVDVVASFRMPAGHGNPSGEVVSATLLQGVQVLAIGARTIVSPEGRESVLGPQADRKHRRLVTLMVNSDQAEALQLASSHGDLTLAMRNPLDGSTSENRGMLLSDLSQDLADRLASMMAANAPHAPLFVSDEAGEETPAAPTMMRTEREPALWTTTILRGGDGETMTFPIEEAK